MTETMKAKRTRRTFTAEFKRHAVELHLHSGLTIAQVCTEFKISPSALSRWVKESRTEVKGTRDPADVERENRRLRMENEFLKKASSYFASLQRNGIE